MSEILHLRDLISPEELGQAIDMPRDPTANRIAVQCFEPVVMPAMESIARIAKRDPAELYSAFMVALAYLEAAAVRKRPQ